MGLGQNIRHYSAFHRTVANYRQVQVPRRQYQGAATNVELTPCHYNGPHADAISGCGRAVRCSNQVLHPQPGIASPDSTNFHKRFPASRISFLLLPVLLSGSHRIIILTYTAIYFIVSLRLRNILPSTLTCRNGSEAAPNPPIVDLNIFLASWMPL